VTDAPQPTPDPTDGPAPTPKAPRRPLPPALDAIALVLAGAAAVLLLGGVLFAFANANAANRASGTTTFRLLAQAANPFVAALALAAAVVVVSERRAGLARQVTSPVALGIATAVSLAVVLLALNGVITDLTADAGAMFRLSNIVSRLGTITLGGYGLWVSATAPAPPGSPPPAGR
jgi:hypothetical protein